MTSLLILRARAEAVFDSLILLWPEIRPQLEYRNPFELLCAAALSAQCTDSQVNRATQNLFARWPGPNEMSSADLAEIESAIRSLGFYHVKAKHLIEASTILMERYGGEVPTRLEDLLVLPGVGRKTANLVRSECFGFPGIIVDTHVLRTCIRLGFGEKKDAADMEKRIAALVPRGRWTQFSHVVNRHGKFTCQARKPACITRSQLGPCPIIEVCPRVGL